MPRAEHQRRALRAGDERDRARDPLVTQHERGLGGEDPRHLAAVDGVHEHHFAIDRAGAEILRRLHVHHAAYDDLGFSVARQITRGDRHHILRIGEPEAQRDVASTLEKPFAEHDQVFAKHQHTLVALVLGDVDGKVETRLFAGRNLSVFLVEREQLILHLVGRRRARGGRLGRAFGRLGSRLVTLAAGGLRLFLDLGEFAALEFVRLALHGAPRQQRALERRLGCFLERGRRRGAGAEPDLDARRRDFDAVLNRAVLGRHAHFVEEHVRQLLGRHSHDLQDFAPPRAAAHALPDDDLGLAVTGDVFDLERRDHRLFDREIVNAELFAFAQVGAANEHELIPADDAFFHVVAGDVDDDVVLRCPRQSLFFREYLFDAALGVDGQARHPRGRRLGRRREDGLHAAAVAVVIADHATQPDSRLGPVRECPPGDLRLERISILRRVRRLDHLSARDLARPFRGDRAGHVARVAGEEQQLDRAAVGERDDERQVIFALAVARRAVKLGVADVAGDVQGRVVERERDAGSGGRRSGRLLVQRRHRLRPLGEHAVQLDRPGRDHVERDGKTVGSGDGGDGEDGGEGREGERTTHFRRERSLGAARGGGRPSSADHCGRGAGPASSW